MATTYSVTVSFDVVGLKRIASAPLLKMGVVEDRLST